MKLLQILPGQGFKMKHHRTSAVIVAADRFQRRTEKYNSNKDSANASGPFPLKLHRLLNTAHEVGLESIVSWCPDGNGFKVHKIDKFVNEVLPRFFKKQTKYKSFQRQLVSTISIYLYLIPGVPSMSDDDVVADPRSS